MPAALLEESGEVSASWLVTVGVFEALDLVLLVELDLVCPWVLVVADALVPVFVCEPPPLPGSSTTPPTPPRTTPASSSAPARLDTGSPVVAPDTFDPALRGAPALEEPA